MTDAHSSFSKAFLIPRTDFTLSRLIYSNSKNICSNQKQEHSIQSCTSLSVDDTYLALHSLTCIVTLYTSQLTHHTLTLGLTLTIFLSLSATFLLIPLTSRLPAKTQSKTLPAVAFNVLHNVSSKLCQIIATETIINLTEKLLVFRDSNKEQVLTT